MNSKAPGQHGAPLANPRPWANSGAGQKVRSLPAPSCPVTN